MSAAPPTKEIVSKAAPTLTISEKFVVDVEKRFMAEMGSPIAWTPLQKTLAQHLYIKIDSELAKLEIKRAGNPYKKDDPAITWANVNKTKLAIDAVNRVAFELDALIKNHIHVIPYLNSRTKQYDIDLRVGYAGIDHTRRKFALEPVLDIRYQLVYEGDKFSIDRSSGWEQPVWEPADYFRKEGSAIGGFGYVTYEDPKKNRVIVIGEREFEKAEKASKGVEFWGGEQSEWKNGKKVDAGYDEKFREEMKYKTVVFRVCDKLALDPAKVNGAALASLESDTEALMTRLDNEEDANANKQQIAFAPTEEIQEGEIVTETPEPAVEEEGATEDHDVKALAATLKLTDDTVTFIADQIKDAGAAGNQVPTLGEFLQGMVTQGVRTLKEIKDAAKALCTPPATAAGEGDPGY